MNPTQSHVGKRVTVRNAEGANLYGDVLAVTPTGAIMKVIKRYDGYHGWITLKRPENQTIRGATVVSDGR